MADTAKQMTEGERLMAEMAQKYGGAVAVSPQQEQPAPQPRPQIQAPQKPSGFMSGIKGILGGRGEQIDKAAGYACGGKIKAHASGGKISGPGTPTSDSITATVRETGENILVSNKERVLSEEQDKLIESMAKKLGFESLDAMLEAGTGNPVGPTMKDGKRAANNGGLLDDPLRKANMSYENVQNGSMPAPVETPSITSIPIGVGAPNGPTIYDNGGIPSASDKLQVTSDKIQVPAKPAPPSMVGGIPAEANIQPVPAAQPKAAPAVQPQADGQRSWYAGTDSRDQRTGLEMERGRRAESTAAGAIGDPVKSALQYGVVGSPAKDGAAQQPGASAQATIIGGANYGNEGRSVPSAITKTSPGAVVDNEFKVGGKDYTANPTSQQGTSRVTAPGTSPLYTNIDPQKAVAGIGNQMIGGDAAAVKEGLDRYANANKIRGEMIANRDKDIPAGGYGPGILGDGGIAADNAEKTARWRQDELIDLASRGNQAAIAAVIGAGARSNDVASTNAAHLQAAEMQNQTARYGHDITAQRAAGHDGILARGQDITGANDAERNKILAKQAEAKQFHQPIAVSGGEVADPNDPMGQRKLKMPNSVYDPNTGKWHTQPQGGAAQQGGAPSFSTPAEVDAAKAAGKIKAGDVISTPNGLIKVK